MIRRTAVDERLARPPRAAAWTTAVVVVFGAAVLSPSFAHGLRDGAPVESSSPGSRATANEGGAAIGSGPRVAQAPPSSGGLRERDGMTVRDSLRTRPIGGGNPQPYPPSGMKFNPDFIKSLLPPPTIAPPAPPPSEPPSDDPPVDEGTTTPDEDPPDTVDTPESGGEGQDTVGTDTPPAVSPPIEAIADAVPELTPAEIAAISGLAGGAALLGSLTMLGIGGVRREEVVATIRDLLAGRIPEDPFEAWKRKWEGLGWTYSERNGVATFDPAEGARNEAGEAWSEREKRFLPVDPRGSTHVFLDPVDGATNERGEVWSENDRAYVQRDYHDQERRRRDDLDRGRAAEIERAERASREEAEARSREDARLAEEIARGRAAREALHAAEVERRARIGARLKTLLIENGGSGEEADRLVREGGDADLEARFARALRERMEATAADAAHWERWAKIHGAGELGAKAIVAGAKTGLLVVAGPAGYVPAVIGSGVVRSAEEGARAWVASGGGRAALGTALVSGFGAGAKDGAVGWFTGLARTGALTRVLLPGAADATETWVRTGDLASAAKTFALSGVAGGIGAKLDRTGGTLVREVGQLATGTAAGGVGAWMNGGKFSEGAVDGLVDAVGGRVGQHIGSHTTPMTRAEIAMDLEHKAKLVDARERVDALKTAIAGGDEAKVKRALHDVLDHREAKQLMGGDGVDAGLKKTYAELTREHRTTPIFEGTAEALNAHKVPGTDEARFVVRGADGSERPVRASDFASGSGSAHADKPGMDLDLYARETIIDRAKGDGGRPANRADVEAAVKRSCEKLGVDPHQQEVNLTGSKGPEDWTMRPGETPAEFTARVRAEGRVSGAEGQGITEVGSHKLVEADRLHGAGAGSSAVAEQARGVMKDHGRLIDALIAGDGSARVPEVFTRRDATTGETPLSILKQIGEGRMPPGTGNAKFRELTGMDIREATPKIASWAEPLGKWGGAMPTAAVPTTPNLVGHGAASNLQQTVGAVVAETLEKRDGG